MLFRIDAIMCRHRCMLVKRMNNEEHIVKRMWSQRRFYKRDEMCVSVRMSERNAVRICVWEIEWETEREWICERAWECECNVVDRWVYMRLDKYGEVSKNEVCCQRHRIPYLNKSQFYLNNSTIIAQFMRSIAFHTISIPLLFRIYTITFLSPFYHLSITFLSLFYYFSNYLY